MKSERRWLKSAIAAANEPQIALPWARGSRRRPAAFQATPPTAAIKPVFAPKAIAAR